MAGGLFRSVKKGGSLLVTGALFLGILVMLNVAAGRLAWRSDWTGENRYSLSPQTHRILASLDREVSILAFLRTSDPDQDELRRLFDEYASASRHLRFEFIDPERRPAEAQRFGIQGYGVILSSGDKKEEARTRTEQGITSALIRLLRPRPVEVAFLSGHGELSPFEADPGSLQAAGQALRDAGYHLRRVTLLTAAVFDSLDLVVIASPRQEFLPAEKALLDGYLSRGGRILALLDPAPGAGLADWLSNWGAVVGPDCIIDGSGRGRLVGLGPETPVVSRYEANPITAGFNLATYYRLARSVRLPEALVPPSRGWLLFRSGAGSWAETTPLAMATPRLDPGKDQLGPVPMAVAVDHPARQARLVVIGDSDFATNRDWRVPGGGDILLNAIAWLTERPEEIAIRAPEVRERRVELDAGQARAIFLGGVIGLPVLVILAGVATAWRRRAL